MTASFNHEPAWSVGAGISSKRESGGWATPDREYICEVQRGSAGVFVRASPTEFSLRWRSQKLGGPIYPSPLRLRGRPGSHLPPAPAIASSAGGTFDAGDSACAHGEMAA